MKYVPLNAPRYEEHTSGSLSNWLHYLSVAEINFLQGIVQAAGERPRCVNIGAGGGTSALAILEARPEATLYTIDVQYEVTPVGGLQNEIGILTAAKKIDPMRYFPIHGNSREVAAEWTSLENMLDPVDVVFVDGGHEYEECRGDLEGWWPLLNEGGYMLVHDFEKVEAYRKQKGDAEFFNYSKEFVQATIKPYPGVDRAVTEFLLNYPVQWVDVADTLIAFRK